MVDNTVGNIAKVADLTEEASSSLGIIVSLIAKAADQIQAIAAASEEQFTASEFISNAVEDVNNISSQTDAAMQQASMAINNLSGQAEKLHNLIGQLQKIRIA